MSRTARRRAASLPVAARLTAVLALAALAGCDGQGSLPGREALRPPEFPGISFPEKEEDAVREVDAFLGAATPLQAPVAGVVVPHASFSFSGRTVGLGLGALKNQPVARVVLLGERHGGRGPLRPFRGAALPAESGFSTAAGPLLNDLDAIERLSQAPGFTIRARAFDGESSLEVLLPFIARLWPEAKLVPILLGRASPEALRDLGARIREELDETTLLVVSTTFTHFDFTGLPEFARSAPKDRVLAHLRGLEVPLEEAIATRDPARVRRALHELPGRLCGERALLAGLHALGPGAAPTSVGLDWSFRDSAHLDVRDISGVSYRALLFPRASER